MRLDTRLEDRKGNLRLGAIRLNGKKTYASRTPRRRKEAAVGKQNMEPASLQMLGIKAGLKKSSSSNGKYARNDTENIHGFATEGWGGDTEKAQVLLKEERTFMVRIRGLGNWLVR